MLPNWLYLPICRIGNWIGNHHPGIFILLIGGWLAISIYVLPMPWNGIVGTIPLYVFAILRITHAGGLFAPSSVSDCLKRLQATIPEADLNALKTASGDDFTKLRDRLGHEVRNQCGMWRKGLVGKYVEEIKKLSGFHAIDPIKNGEILLVPDQNTPDDKRVEHPRPLSWIIIFLLRDAVKGNLDVDGLNTLIKA